MGHENKNDVKINLHDTMDASIWASEFVRITKKNSISFQNHDFQDFMLGWFANAIMAGYDAATAKSATNSLK